MDLKLQFILDLRPHQLRHDEVLLNRSGCSSDYLPAFLRECPLPFGVANFPVICLYQYYFMTVVAKSLRSTFLNEILNETKQLNLVPRAIFFKRIKKPLFRLPPLAKRCAWDELDNN